MATADGLSANVSLAVMSGPLPVGTTRWSGATLPGYSTMASVGTQGSDGTSLATAEFAYGEAGQPNQLVVRGFDLSGAQTSQTAVPLAIGETVRDMFGAVGGGTVVRLTSFEGYSLVRAPLSAEDGAAWSVALAVPDVSGPFQLPESTNVAQAPEGTVFTVADRALVAIDGQTGQQRFQIRPPRYVDLNPACPYLGEVPRGLFRFISDVAIDTDGNANIEVLAGAPTDLDTPCNTQKVDFTVQLYRVSPSGVTTVVDLHAYRYADQSPGAGWWFPETWVGQYHPELKPLVDEQGGVLAMWAVCHPHDQLPVDTDCESRGRHASPTGLGVEYTLPYSYDVSLPTISASGRIAYYGGSFGTTAIDMVTGVPIWANATPGEPMAALSDGAVAIVARVTGDPAGTTLVDSAGNTVATGLGWDAGMAYWGVRSLIPDTSIGDMWVGKIGASIGAMVQRPKFLSQTSGSPTKDGNRLRGFAPPSVYLGEQGIENGALAAMDWIWVTSYRRNLEYGGLVCQPIAGVNRYYITGPVDDGDSGQTLSPSDPAVSCGNSLRVGRYHTHGKFDQVWPSGTNVFPSGDIQNADQVDWQGVLFYATTPPMIDASPGPKACPELGCFATDPLEPARSIYRWQGPNALQNHTLMQKLPAQLGDPFQNGGWMMFPQQPQIP